MNTMWYRVPKGKQWYREGEELLSEIASTPGAPDELAFWKLGQCGICFRYAEKTLLIDPILNEMLGADGKTVRNFAPPFDPAVFRVDYVLCTHAHDDHMAPETLRGLYRANPALRLILPAGCADHAKAIGLPAGSLIPLGDGDSVLLDCGIRVTGLSAAHPAHETDGSMALAYAVDFGAIRAVHLGDTLLTERLFSALQAAGAIDLFFPPINGSDFFRTAAGCIGNMEAEEAAKLAVELGVDLSVPTHFDLMPGNTADPFRFAGKLRELCPGAKFALPALGERVLYRS